MIRGGDGEHRPSAPLPWSEDFQNRVKDERGSPDAMGQTGVGGTQGVPRGSGMPLGNTLVLKTGSFWMDAMAFQ